MARKRRNAALDAARAAYEAGQYAVWSHPLFGPLATRARMYRREPSPVRDDGWAIVSIDGDIAVHPRRRQSPEEWAYVLATALLHLGFDHFTRDRPDDPVPWNAACSATLARFLRDLKFGKPPFPERGMILLADLPARTERAWFASFERDGLPEEFADISIAGPGAQPLVMAGRTTDLPNWPRLLADGVRESARLAVEVASGARDSLAGEREPSSRVQRAREFFMSSYPLLGALAAHFRLIEDAEICRRWNISIAAVSEPLEEIYVNPAAALSDSELVFVYAHELLHVGLRHHDRCEGRDAYLWNIACDFVINQWLCEMNVGTMPARGLMLDAELKGLSAENVYDRMTADMRVYRKLATLAGTSVGDMLDKRGGPRRGDGAHQT